MTKDAVLLGGPLGLGHEMMARSCAEVLERSEWRTRHLDSMSLLGPWRGGMGAGLFHRLVAIPGLYDGLHFAHLRTGSRLAELMDRAASARLVPALRAELDREPADLVISVFATGASSAAKLKAQAAPNLRTVVLCTDVAVHRMWVAEGTDLFLVTSPAAAASVRRYLPRAAVAIVPSAGARRFLRRSDAAAGQSGARSSAARFLRAGHRQRLGVRPAGAERAGARRGGRPSASGSRPGPQARAPVPGTGRPDAPNHAVRFYRPNSGADGRRRPRHRAARRRHLRRGAGGGTPAAAPGCHAGPWARQPATRAGAGRSTRVRYDSSRGYRQRPCSAGRRRRPGAADCARTALGARLGGGPAADRPGPAAFRLSGRRPADRGCAPITNEDAMRGAGSR